MLDIRPIVVNSDMIILGGNMRYRACEAAGLKEIPIIVADNLTPEQQREFLIKDNISGGEWDWNLLANEWDQNELTEWGLDVISIDDSNLDDYFEEASANSEKGKFQIVLNYTEGEYNEITDKLKNIGGSKEAIVYDLIMKE